MSYFTSDAVANAMKYTDRRYRNGEYVAEVLLPIRNLEIFLKQPAGMSIERYLSVEMIVMNGMITDEGYRLLLSLVVCALNQYPSSVITKNGMFFFG